MSRLGDRNEMVDVRRLSTVFWRLPPNGTMAGFSAYSNLLSEGRLNNDADTDLLTRAQADARFVDPAELDAALQSYRVEQSVADVSDPPTDAELDAAFGTPAELGRGFVGLVDDDDDDTKMWLCATSDASWYYIAMTKAV